MSSHEFSCRDHCQTLRLLSFSLVIFVFIVVQNFTTWVENFVIFNIKCSRQTYVIFFEIEIFLHEKNKHDTILFGRYVPIVIMKIIWSHIKFHMFIKTFHSVTLFVVFYVNGYVWFTIIKWKLIDDSIVLIFKIDDINNEW